MLAKIIRWHRIGYSRKLYVLNVSLDCSDCRGQGLAGKMFDQLILLQGGILCALMLGGVGSSSK